MADARARLDITHHHRTWRTDPGRQDHTTWPSAHVLACRFECWRVLTPEATRRRCQRRVVRARAPARFPALQGSPRPAPSRPSLPSPRFVTIAIRPLSRARVCCLYG